MKSKIEVVPHSDVFNRGYDLEKIVVNFDELLQALQEDRIPQLVREILRPRWGSSPLFHFIVADQVNALLGLVADKLREANKDGFSLATLMNVTEIERAGYAYKEKLEITRPFGYWVGENKPIQGSKPCQ